MVVFVLGSLRGWWREEVLLWRWALRDREQTVEGEEGVGEGSREEGETLETTEETRERSIVESRTSSLGSSPVGVLCSKSAKCRWRLLCESRT